MPLIIKTSIAECLRFFLVILTTFLTLIGAPSESTAKTKATPLKTAGVVAMFNVKKWEQKLLKPVVRLILSNYDQRLFFEAYRMADVGFTGLYFSGTRDDSEPQWREILEYKVSAVVLEEIYSSLLNAEAKGLAILKSDFTDKIIPLLQENDAVDIFVLGHTNDADRFLLTQIPENLRRKIRLVYNSGCGDGMDKRLKSWLDQKVGAVVAHSGYSWSPLFLSRFLISWNLGYSIAEAVNQANEAIALNIGSHLVNWLDRSNTPDGIFDGTMATYRGMADLNKYSDFNTVSASLRH